MQTGTAFRYVSNRKLIGLVTDRRTDHGMDSPELSRTASPEPESDRIHWEQLRKGTKRQDNKHTEGEQINIDQCRSILINTDQY